MVELLNTCDIVCGQEHVLISPELHQLGKISIKFRTYSCSAMDGVISDGVLRDRPFDEFYK